MCTWFGQNACTELAACTKQERKPEKINFKSQKEDCKGTLHKPQIPLLSTAALLQCRKNRQVFVPFALPQLSPAQEGEPGKGSKLRAVSPPHLLRPPQAALLGGMPLKLTVHMDSPMSFAVTEAQVCLSPVPLLTRWALPQSHQEPSETAPQPF